MKYLIVAGPDGYESFVADDDVALHNGILRVMENADGIENATPETKELVERICDPEAEWRTDIPAWHTESFEDGFLHVIAIHN